MSEWKEFKLGEIVKFFNGRAYKNTEFKLQGTPIVRIQNLTGEGKTVYSDLNLDPNKYIEKGDLIYAWSATFGPYIWKGPKSIYHYHIWKIECDEFKVDKFYLFYLLNHISDKLKEAGGNGTLFIHITKGFIESYKVKIPPLPTQKVIAEILSSLDDKIELNNQINQNLEAMAQAVFKQWFVDFEFPNENGEPYKSSGGEMVNSELGEIPKGWRIGALSNIIDFNPTEKLAKGEMTSYLDMSSLPTFGSFPEFPIQREFTSGMKFRNGDTLLARITPCLENGKTAFIQFLKPNEVAWGSTEFIVLRPKSKWPKEVGYLIAREENFRNFAIQNLVGTSGRQRVASSILMNYFIPIPQNESIAENFGIIVFDLFEKIKANSFENIYLKKLRDTLLPKLIVGELEVN